MIKLKYNKKTYSVKNTTDELTLKQFEDISNILNDKSKQSIERWSDVFIYLGVPAEVVDDFDATAFISIIKEFNITKKVTDEVFKDFEIEGIKYVAYDDAFKITVKEMALIEAHIQKNTERYLGELMAILYKRTDADRTINYDKAHIHHKAELFRKHLPAKYVVPILGYLSIKIITESERLQNEA